MPKAQLRRLFYQLVVFRSDAAGPPPSAKLSDRLVGKARAFIGEHSQAASARIEIPDYLITNRHGAAAAFEVALGLVRQSRGEYAGVSAGPRGFGQ